jgi:hypothetical protein
LLVFSSLDKAERFCRTVGAGLPQFKPVEVGIEAAVQEGLAVGGFCVADGLRVGVVSVCHPRRNSTWT